MSRHKIYTYLLTMPRWRPLTVILFFIVLAASLLVLIMPEERGIGGLNSPIVGQSVPRTIFARVRFETIDFEKTNAAKKEAGEVTPDYYTLNPAETERLLNVFRTFCSDLQKFKTDHSGTQTEDNAGLKAAALHKQLPADNFKYLQFVLSDRAFCKEFLTRVEKRILKHGIFSEQQVSLLSPRREIYISQGAGRTSPEFGPFSIDEILTPQRAADQIVSLLLTQYNSKVPERIQVFRATLSKDIAELLRNGNITASTEKTDRVKNAAKKNVVPRLKTYYRGQRLFTKDKKFTEEDLQRHRDYMKALLNEQQHEASLNVIMPRCALVIIFMLFTMIYIRNVHPHIMEQRRIFLSLVIITIISLVANQQAGIFFRLLSGETNILPLFIFLCLPLALPSLLLGAIFGFRAAVFAGLYISGVTAISLDNSFAVFISGLFLNGIAAFVVRNSSDYKKFFMSAFLVISATNFMLGLIFLPTDFSLTADLQMLKSAAALSLLSGLVTPILALVVLFLLETFFDVSSTMSYISLTDRNHPLLKRLQQEAPGTYHHSERVASLAEKAAGQIGVNPLLVQACALFHDIGKLANPTLFTENTAIDNPDPHANLMPEESARIIREHVTYGLELAKKYKLKSPLCRAITQHHGTDFISFFYDLAKHRNPDNPPREENFRYPGPVPMDRETVLISLADCAEAVSRSIPNLTKESLDEKLAAIFQTKLSNGQLDNAPITAAELSLIRKSFVSSLCAMSHVRIAYPTFKEEKKDKI